MNPNTLEYVSTECDPVTGNIGDAFTLGEESLSASLKHRPVDVQVTLVDVASGETCWIVCLMSFLGGNTLR